MARGGSGGVRARSTGAVVAALVREWRHGCALEWRFAFLDV